MDMKMSYVEYRNGGYKKLSKHKNVPMVYKKVKYHSTKEAGYASYLDGLKIIGEVKKWTGQVPFEIVVNGVKICKYILDFKVEYSNGKIEYVDVKPFDKRKRKFLLTPTYVLKKKLVQAVFGIKITEK